MNKIFKLILVGVVLSISSLSFAKEPVITAPVSEEPMPVPVEAPISVEPMPVPMPQ